MIKKAKKEVKSGGFLIQVRSRHPSHIPLRKHLKRLPFRSLVRLGSTTEINDGIERVELNSIPAIRNSSSKLLMKQCFSEANVKTAEWFTFNAKSAGSIVLLPQGNAKKEILMRDMKYPLIIKSLFGSRGRGNSKINTFEELQAWISSNKDLKNYIVEEYKSYSREYRLHVSKDGCFYTCRKMLKRDTPEDKKFQRHDDNCVWFLEENAGFEKPVNWDDVVSECVKALRSLKLDIGAFDLKIQSAKDKNGSLRKTCDFIVIESCSAPSFGELTLSKYLEEIPKLLINKKQNREQNRDYTW